MSLIGRLRSHGWTRWLGEILLIFVGITAALSVDRWNDEREERRTEVAVLRDVQAALASDTADLNESLRRFDRVFAATATVKTALDQDRAYSPELGVSFAEASLQTISFLDFSAYERLVSLGRDLVQDDDLRSQIGRYYSLETEWLLVHEERWMHELWRTSVLPQMMAKFAYQFIQPDPSLDLDRRPAVPHDLEALRTDPDFRTMLMTHREAVRLQESYVRLVLERAENLIENIDRDLALR